MIRAFELLLVLGGCNQLFGIDETFVVDAAPQIDSTLIVDPVCDPPFVVRRGNTVHLAVS